jgi:hypothetical protein
MMVVYQNKFTGPSSFASKVLQPQKSTKSTKEFPLIFLCFCASLWLILLQRIGLDVDL